MAWDTSANIVNDAALELSLVSASVADVYASTSDNIRLLRALLKAAGQDLIRAHQWSHLQREHTFSTVNGTASYSLPADFLRLLDQSGWNRTDVFPLGGPVSGQGWQALKAITTTPYQYAFRIWLDAVYLHPTPSAADSLAFEYLSRYWVQPSGQSTPTTEAPTANTDTLWLDRRLLVTRLKRDFLLAKGLPAQHAVDEYEAALSSARGNDGAAPVLDLTSAGRGRLRLLDGQNVPETGFGS